MNKFFKQSGLLVCAALITACASTSDSPEVTELPRSGSGQLDEIVVTANKSVMAGANRLSVAKRQPSVLGIPRHNDHSDFPEYSENAVKLTAEEPISTFSVDVDTSSYSVMRSYIVRGDLPPAAAIRTEELLNYFNYQYPLPASKDQPFEPQISVFTSPWSSDKKLIRVGVKGYNIEPKEQPDSNLVFLLDVSGSMNAQNKLPLLVKSIKLLLKNLKPTDMVSIVVYAGASGVVLEPMPASQSRDIHKALDRLHAGGGTAGGEGLALAYEVAKENYNKDAVNRIIIGTDGDFNVGPQSNSVLKKMVEKNRDSGIYLSVLGFGRSNYQDDMMQAIAQYGNGTAAYIDTLQEAKKVLVDEATSSLFPIANDVKIQLEFNPENVVEYRLMGYETRKLKRQDFNNDKVDAGEIGAGHTVTALYEITTSGSAARRIEPLRYAKNVPEVLSQEREFKDELGFVKIRYKLPGESNSNLISKAIKLSGVADDEALFAVSVASFAELLRGSNQIEDYDFDDVASLAKLHKGEDPNGYRAEFIRLVEMAHLLAN